MCYYNIRPLKPRLPNYLGMPIEIVLFEPFVAAVIGKQKISHSPLFKENEGYRKDNRGFFSETGFIFIYLMDL